MELMEQPPAEARQTPACANCGSALIEPPGRTPICDSCRHQFINYPIPVWIKAFGIGILAVLVFSVFNLSRNISTGIHYKRGSVAASKKNYLTAEKEFGRVAKIEPDYTE